MSNTSDHVVINVTVEGSGTARAGFGGMLILSHNADFPDRSRAYNDAPSVLDDFDDDSPEYLAAVAAFAQNPRPPQVKIGRMTADVTLKYELALSEPDDAQLYSVEVHGQGFEDTTVEYTSGTGATLVQIHAGLADALNTQVNAELVFADKTFTADNTIDTLTTVAHGFQTGDGPARVSNSGGALPTGLAVDTDYYVIVTGANTYKLATSRENAVNGYAIDFTTDGTGTQTIADVADETRRITKNYTATFAPKVVADTVFTADNTTNEFTAVAHGLVTGDGPVRVSNSGGALPTGLVAATDYYAIRVDADTFMLAATRADAFAGDEVDITTNGTGTQTLADTASTTSPNDGIVVTGDALGNWFALGIDDSMTQTTHVAMTHTVSNIADDLAAITDADDDWYCAIVLYPSADYALDVAAWVESNNRVFVVDFPETDALNTVVAGASDAIAQLFELGYTNTMAAYHKRPWQFLAAAWMGRWLPTTPGKATTKFKTLSGITVNKLTATQRNNLRNRRGNTYERVAGRGITWEGTVPSTVNKFFDVTRNVHWLYDELQASVFGTLADADIVPYTSEGIQVVRGAINSSLDLGTTQGVLSRDEPFSITMPAIKDVDVVDKGDRTLRNVKATGTLSGAIHKAIVDVSVSF